jgi:hypothetical protein
MLSEMFITEASNIGVVFIAYHDKDIRQYHKVGREAGHPE